MKMPTQEKTNLVLKNAVTTMIKNISIIAIFVMVGIILLLYLGPEINMTTSIVFKMAVPSVVLAIGVTILHELWMRNGRQSAYEEEDYQGLLKTFAQKSEGLHYPTMQEFLDNERQRRYDVEYDRLSRMIEREQSSLTKMQNYIKKNNKKINKTTRRIDKIIMARDSIRVSMPYEKSEEFDYLRYNIQDIIYKEYSPNDVHKHLTKARIKKYTFVILFCVVGLNILSIGGSMGNIWVAIIMTTLSSVSLIYAVVTGFSTGYHNIKVISTGVYKTANSFLDQAVAYCLRVNKDLYYKGVTEFREYKPNILEEKIVKEDEDIFTKAAEEVTKRSH